MTNSYKEYEIIPSVTHENMQKLCKKIDKYTQNTSTMKDENLGKQ